TAARAGAVVALAVEAVAATGGVALSVAAGVRTGAGVRTEADCCFGTHQRKYPAAALPAAMVRNASPRSGFMLRGGLRRPPPARDENFGSHCSFLSSGVMGSSL